MTMNIDELECLCFYYRIRIRNTVAYTQAIPKHAFTWVINLFT